MHVASLTSNYTELYRVDRVSQNGEPASPFCVRPGFRRNDSCFGSALIETVAPDTAPDSGRTIICFAGRRPCLHPKNSFLSGLSGRPC